MWSGTGRGWLPAWLAAAACAITGSACLAQSAPPGPNPVFSAQLELRDGFVALVPGSATVDFRQRGAAFAACALQAPAVAETLAREMQQHLKQRGKLLEQLLSPEQKKLLGPALQTLAQQDPATQRLWQAPTPLSWREANEAVNSWKAARRAEVSALAAVQLSLSDLYSEIAEKDDSLQDGPLRAFTDPDRLRALQGWVDFELMPPLPPASQIKLRPTANQAQWQQLRGALLEQALAPQACSLWRRAGISTALKRYLEPRGIAVDAPATAVALAAGLKPDRATVEVLSPRWNAGPVGDGDEGDGGVVGGRIKVAPDPLLEAVYLRVDGQTAPALLWQMLYLLLPSSDYHRVHQAPAQHLCLGPAVWLPPVEGQPRAQAVQLPLDTPAPALEFSQRYLTRQALAERLRRLAVLGQEARIELAHERLPDSAAERQAARARGENPMQRRAVLVVQATAPDSASAAPFTALALPACATRREAASAASLPTAPTAPASSLEAAGPTPPREQARELHNHIEVSAELRSGKPLRWEGRYRREGLGAADSFSIGLGQQRETSGVASYSRDFVAFDTLQRRLQLTLNLFSRFTPDRPLGTAGSDPTPDERRDGASLHAVLDLWRDRAESFAQAEFSLERSQMRLSGSALPERRLTLAHTQLVWVRPLYGTAASPYTELLLQTTRGRHGSSEGLRTFTRTGVQAAWQGFISTHTRAALRLAHTQVSALAPTSEYASFGGAESVRGYAEERSLARRVTLLQTEVAMPWPGANAGGDERGLATLLQRTLSIAAIADVAKVSGSNNGLNGRRAALGLGLRWHQAQGLSLKLDLARPVGTVPSGDRHWHVHLGVVSIRLL